MFGSLQVWGFVEFESLLFVFFRVYRVWEFGSLRV